MGKGEESYLIYGYQLLCEISFLRSRIQMWPLSQLFQIQLIGIICYYMQSLANFCLFWAKVWLIMLITHWA